MRKRRSEKCPGLAAVDRLERRERRRRLDRRRRPPVALQLGSPFGLEVGHLAGHHPRRAGRLGQDPHALERRRPGPDLARHHLERQRQEPVARQDRRGLVKRPVTGRPAAPQVVVVHRRQVVVNQRISVNHLERTGRRQRRIRIRRRTPRPPSGKGPDAAACRPPAHCNASPWPAAPDTPRRSRVNLGQVAAQAPPRPAGAPSPDTRPARTPRSMSWENSSCFNRFNRFP